SDVFFGYTSAPPRPQRRAAVPEQPYPRDLVGYGSTPPDPRWPGGARIAVQFLVNFEEGGEMSVLHGDKYAEVYLQQGPGASPRSARDLAVESIHECGTRAGFWRLFREFERRRLNFTTYAVGMAIERCPEHARALIEGGHEIASHGWRWIDYQA